MQTNLQITGLDSYLGFLHEPRLGHAALASDLIEEFRAPIFDSLVVLLINRREITSEDFVQQPGGELWLSANMLPQFLTRYEDRLATRVRCRRTHNQFTYRQMMERQARLIARIIRGEEQEYLAYRWDY
jgi:CRISP-associated protein Cas1